MRTAEPKPSGRPLWFTGFIALLALAPLPFGSNRFWASDMLGLGAGLLLALCLFDVRRDVSSRPANAPWRWMAFSAAAVFAVLAWGFLQTTSWIPSPHPLWADAARALGEAPAASASLTPDLFAECALRILSYAACFLIAFFAARDAARAAKNAIINFTVRRRPPPSWRESGLRRKRKPRSIENAAWNRHTRFMLNYFIRRLLLIVPTLFGIMVLNFCIVQAAPGGPIEQIVAKLHGTDVAATARFGGSAAGETATPMGQAMKMNEDAAASRYPGAQGVDPELIKELEHQFGFDQPLYKRFLLMIGHYARFDFGKSYFRDESVFHLVVSKMPVSISIGLWTTLIVYLISIPLGIRKAVKDGTSFDVWTSAAIIAGYAIPSFLFAVLLIVVFAGGRYLDWFPLRGLTSDNWGDMDWPHRVLDYFWHIALPVAAMVIGGFASLTMLTKNSFLDEINKQYVLTARAKGLTETRVLYGHVFRNAMLIVIAGFPSAFISILFTGSLLIEVIFSLDGMGLLGFESAINRDYPVMFGTLYFFTLLGLVMNVLGDLAYVLTDPRIDFETREG